MMALLLCGRTPAVNPRTFIFGGCLERLFENPKVHL